MVIGIGKNDRDENYLPNQVMIPLLTNAVRETEVKIKEILSFLEHELPDLIKDKYVQKLNSLVETKYKFIYSLLELNYDITQDHLYGAEMAALIGDTHYSSIER